MIHSVKACCALCLLAMLGACTWPAAEKAKGQPVLMPMACQVIEGTPTEQSILTATTLQRQTERSPLYTLPASGDGFVACQIRHQAEGVVVLEYQFRNDAWLHVKRDPRIEYSEQNARFTLPGQQQAILLLADAERSAFGPKGCGIDWSQSETKASDTDAGGIDTIFRGNVCNCQAHIRRNANGSAVGFKLASAC